MQVVPPPPLPQPPVAFNGHTASAHMFYRAPMSAYYAAPYARYAPLQWAPGTTSMSSGAVATFLEGSLTAAPVPPRYPHSYLPSPVMYSTLHSMAAVDGHAAAAVWSRCDGDGGNRATKGIDAVAAPAALGHPPPPRRATIDNDGFLDEGKRFRWDYGDSLRKKTLLVQEGRSAPRTVCAQLRNSRESRFSAAW